MSETTLSQRIRNTQQNRLRPRSKDSYFSFISDFCLYFVSVERRRLETSQEPIPNYRSPFTDIFMRFYIQIEDLSERMKKKEIRAALEQEPPPNFFDFNSLGHIHFKMFASECRTKEGNKFTFGTVKNKKSGFVHIWKIYGHTFERMNDGVDAEELSQYLTGLQNELTDEALQNGGTVRFETYT